MIYKRFLSGQGIVEYALILVFVFLVVIFILGIFGTQIGNTFSSIINQV